MSVLRLCHRAPADNWSAFRALSAGSIYKTTGQLCWVGTNDPSSCTDSSGQTYHYGYDDDGDLYTKSDHGTTTNYGYDLAGELCYSGSTSGVIVDTNCPTTPGGDTSYANDKAGNLTGTNANPNRITYNNDNQAASLAPLSGGTSVTMTYQDHGNQLRGTVGSTTLDNGPLGVTARTIGSSTTYYTRDPQGNLIDERTTTGGTTTTYYYLTDRQNSVIALIDNTGADAGDYHYDPYGGLTNSGSLTTAATANPWRYTSAYQDIEGDNYYHLDARYYDANTARFTQPDSINGSIAAPRTTNHFVYTGGDPINGTDSTGESWLGVAVGIGLGALGIAAGGIGLVYGIGEIAAATTGAEAVVGGADIAAGGAVGATSMFAGWEVGTS